MLRCVQKAVKDTIRPPSKKKYEEAGSINAIARNSLKVYLCSDII